MPPALRQSPSQGQQSNLPPTGPIVEVSYQQFMQYGMQRLDELWNRLAASTDNLAPTSASEGSETVSFYHRARS